MVVTVEEGSSSGVAEELPGTGSSEGAGAGGLAGMGWDEGIWEGVGVEGKPRGVGEETIPEGGVDEEATTAGGVDE